VRLDVLCGGIPDSLVPGIVRSQGFLGTFLSVSALLGHRSMFLGLPFKVSN
jgi:hypothetical protein